MPIEVAQEVTLEMQHNGEQNAVSGAAHRMPGVLVVLGDLLEVLAVQHREYHERVPGAEGYGVLGLCSESDTQHFFKVLLPAL